jgi:hypothetical protein
MYKCEINVYGEIFTSQIYRTLIYGHEVQETYIYVDEDIH